MALPAAFRVFAIVPAAGASRRMGRPKLLLPLGKSTLIEQTLAAWKECDTAAIVVVVRPDDADLAAVCRSCGAEVVVPPCDPPEMRDSVELALAYVEKTYAPSDKDVWLLAPADMPQLSPRVVAALLAAHRPGQPTILVPTIGGRRGHPVLFPWPSADEVRRLAAGEGINVLTQRPDVREIPCDGVGTGPAAFEDIDTQEEYQRLNGGGRN